MKTLAWLFGIFVCASSAYGQKTVTIEGYIRNMPDTVRFFCAEMKGNGMDVRPEDQEKMVNGKFKFTREADRTTKMYISLNNTGYTVWVKPGAHIKITGEAPYVKNWLAESDIPIPEQVELNRFREATGIHTHPRLNGRVYETAPQDQSERFGRQTGIRFDQADGKQHT